jgi:tRNA pseudouridine38-40 synthase
MRWKCKVAYDGTAFNGWQSQSGGNTIQDLIEARLRVLLDAPVRIYGSGRTDSGVHARGQVFHFDGNWTAGADTLLRALKSGYPHTIQVFDAEPVDDHFHARFSATGKQYVYQIFEGDASPFETRFHWSLGRRRLVESAMSEAAAILCGRHDFTAFTANAHDDRHEDCVRELRRLEVVRDGAYLKIITEADGYLYRMVRSLVGCLVEVGLGKLSVADVKAMLQTGVRGEKVQTAPPQGLFLEKVFYKDEGGSGLSDGGPTSASALAPAKRGAPENSEGPS